MLAVHLSQDNPDAYFAAATLIASMTNTIVSLSMSPLFALSLLASRERGKLNHDDVIHNLDKTLKINKKIADIFRGGVILSTFILPFAFTTMYFSKTILINFFKQDPLIAELSQEYLRPYSCALPALMYRMCEEQMMFSFNKTFFAMSIGLVNFGLGTGLAYLFTREPFKLGLSGISYGYLVEAYLTFIGFGLYLARNKAFKDVPFFTRFKINTALGKQFKGLFCMGGLIAVQMFFELSATVLIGAFAGWLGTSQLAAQDSTTQLFIFSIIPSIAFGQTVSQYVSRFIGKEDFQNAMRFARWGFLTSVGLTAIINIPLVVASQWLIRLLPRSPPSPQAINMSKLLMPLAATQAIYDASGYGMAQTLRATGERILPTFLKIICLGVGLVISYSLGFHTYLDIYGVDIGFLLGIALGAMLLLPQWLVKTSAEHIEHVCNEKKFKSPTPEKLIHRLGIFGGINNKEEEMHTALSVETESDLMLNVVS